MGELHHPWEKFKSKGIINKAKKSLSIRMRGLDALEKHMQQSTQTNIGSNLLNDLKISDKLIF